MKMIGNEPRIKVHINTDETFILFLKQKSKQINLSISQMFEQATIKKYQNEYDEFLETQMEKEN